MLYDTIIIGCGYTALGYAIANKNSLILEARETLDTSFALSARRFSYTEREPKTEIGKVLLGKLYEKGLISDGMMNATALEVVISDLAIEYNANIRLKSRVIKTDHLNDRFRVSVISNAGIEHYFARRIIDMRSFGDKIFTLLFEARDGENISSIPGFEDSTIEPAFYKNRYALHTKVCKNARYSDTLIKITERWEQNSNGKKMLYIAPAFGYESPSREDGCISDADFSDPISAIDYGYKLGSGGAI